MRNFFKTTVSLLAYVVLFGFAGSAHADVVYNRTDTVGGTVADFGYSVAIDQSDNVYTTGYFTNTVDFDPGTGTDNRTSSSSSKDIYLSKYAADGSYEWTRTVGGSGSDTGYSVTTDTQGSVYITGSFASTVDFDPGTGTDTKTSAGSYDMYISKYTTDGTYQWTKTVGGTGEDSGSSITANSSNEVFVTGRFSNTTDFDPEGTTDTKTSVGSFDTFITKYAADGAYRWTKVVGGTGVDIGSSITVDATDTLVVTGRFSNIVDFDPSVATDTKTSLGSRDIFTSKYASDGTYLWTNRVGGTDWDEGYSVTTDTEGNIYVTGLFAGTVDFDPGLTEDIKTTVGISEIFLTKYASDGSYEWTKTTDGIDDNGGWSVTTDSSDNIYVTGYFSNSVDFDPSGGVDNRTSAGAYDVFLSKYLTDGTYQWTKAVGGTDYDMGESVTTNSSDDVYVVGVFINTVDFNSDVGEDSKTSTGNYDIFLSQYILPIPLTISNVSVTPDNEGAVVAWDTNLESDSVVNYGLDSGYGSSTSNAVATTSHQITLNGLSACTNYNFSILSTEGIYNQTASTSDAAFFTLDCVNEGGDVSQYLNDISLGIISIDGADPTSTNEVTFNTDYSITEDSISVLIPEDTTMTKTGGGTINFTELAIADMKTSLLNAYTGDIAGAISIGIPNLKLTFSQPITVTIPVNSVFNGQTLNVYYQNAGESVWILETSCTIVNGACTFLTTHATIYSAGDKPASLSSSSSGSSSGSSRKKQTVATSTKITQPASSTVPSQHYFGLNFTVGDIHSDVAFIQRYLNTHGYILVGSGPGSPGNETSVFGPYTRAALTRFQGDHGLPATGFFGPMTREKFNSTNAPTDNEKSLTDFTHLLIAVGVIPPEKVTLALSTLEGL